MNDNGGPISRINRYNISALGVSKFSVYCNMPGTLQDTYAHVGMAGTYKEYVLDLSEKWFTIENGHIRIHCSIQGAPFPIWYRVNNLTTGESSPWFKETSAGLNNASWLDAATTGGNQYNYTVDYTFDIASGCFNTKSIGSVNVDTQAPSGTISAPADNASKTVNLTLAGTDNVGVTQMRFSPDNATWNAWEAYSTQKAYTVTTEGTHNVYVQFKDAMGNVSTGTLSATFNVDITAPTGSVNTSNGTAFVGSTAELALSATDNVAPYQMRIAQVANFSGAAWVAYNTASSFNVTGADGAKTLYVQYRDKAGNLSPVYSLPVTKDTIAPDNCTVALQGLEGIVGETKSQSITVVASGSDTNGIYGIAVSNDNSSWTPVCTTKVGDEFQFVNHLLTEGRGIKTVYVKVYDSAGNFTVVSDTIRYDEDTTLPICSVSIKAADGSETFSISPEVNLTIIANDNATFTNDLMVRASNDGEHWSAYQAYSASMTWNLVTGPGGTTTEGSKTVYINVKDGSSNVGYATDSISYSSVKPDVSSSTLQNLVNSIADSNINVVTGLYEGEEVLYSSSNVVFVPLPLSGAISYRTAVAGGDYGEWWPYNSANAQKIQLGLGEGVIEVRIQGKNANGAISDEFTFKFVVDRTAPFIKSLKGLNGATATKTDSVALFADVTDNNSGNLFSAYSINGNPFTPQASLGVSGQKNQFTVSGLIAGVNSILVNIYDLCGNFSTGEATIFRI